MHSLTEPVMSTRSRQESHKQRCSDLRRMLSLDVGPSTVISLHFANPLRECVLPLP